MTREDMESAIDDFIAELTDDEKASNTLVKYERVSKELINALEREKEITKKDIIDYKTELMKQFAPATVRNYITIINKFLSYVEYRTLDRRTHKSSLEVKQIREQQVSSLSNIINDNEYERMIKYAKKLGYEDMVMIMKIFAHTGIRESELKDFTIENLKNKTVIRTYSKGKVREIAITQSLKNEINDYIRKNKIKESYLFKGRKGDLISRFTVYKKFQKIAGAARIPLKKAHAHSFRHLFAKKYVEEGFPTENLADVLGHSSTETTRIYLRTSTDEWKERLEKISYKSKKEK